jgi:hypothetical protein
MNEEFIEAKASIVKAPKRLLWAQKIANISDTAVHIPGLNFSIGLDSIIGLIPVVGDALMLCASLTLIGLGRSLGVPKGIQLLMLRNAAIDFFVGMIPIAGDIFDIFFKANKRNVRLLEHWWLQENQQHIQQSTQEKIKQWSEDS